MSVNLNMDGQTYENATSIAVGGKTIEIEEVSSDWTDIVSVDGLSDGGTQSAYGALRIPLSQSQVGTNIVTIVNKDANDATNVLAIVAIVFLDSDGNVSAKNASVKYKSGQSTVIAFNNIKQANNMLRFWGNSSARMNTGTEYKYKVQWVK